MTRKKMFKLAKRILKLILSAVLLMAALIWFSDYWIKRESHGMKSDSLDEIPFNTVGLVFGTSKWLVGGSENPYFKYRMEAASELYKAGKIKYLIVSGDNSIREYNETREMKNSLLELGVPEDKIVEDFAGFRTLDSVLRAKEVFGQDSLTFISQEFQNERALFIAKNHDIYGVGYNAKNISATYARKVIMREYLARVRAILDVYVLRTMPKFYKDKEVFPSDE